MADDYDDEPRSGAKGPLDNMFANTNLIILIIFGVCCRGLAFILALVCFLTAKDPKAKSNATIVMAIDGGLIILAIILNVAGVLGGFAAR